LNILAFEERHDRHRVAKPKTEVGLEPGEYGASLHARSELAAHRETLIRRGLAEVRGTLARFRLYVAEVGLK
jgi:hypothetical protein